MHLNVLFRVLKICLQITRQNILNHSDNNPKSKYHSLVDNEFRLIL